MEFFEANSLHSLIVSPGLEDLTACTGNNNGEYTLQLGAVHILRYQRLTNRSDPNPPSYVVASLSTYVVNVILWLTPSPPSDDNVIYEQPLTQKLKALCEHSMQG